jgi:hypothetical protein
MSRSARGEQIASALPAEEDLSETCQIRRDGPHADAGSRPIITVLEFSPIVAKRSDGIQYFG